jgi:transposase
MLHKRGAAYWQDLRERVLAKAAEGATVSTTARALHVTSSYVSKVLGRLRSTGERTARPQRCHVPPKLAPLYSNIRQQVAERPDITLAELRAWLLEAYKISVSDGLMTKTLKLLGLTFKNVWPAPLQAASSI